MKNLANFWHFQNYRIQTKTAGFSLIQTIITICIFLSIFLTTTLLVTNSMNTISFSQSQVRATYLAQECLEISRNIRDSAWKQKLPFDCAFDETNSLDACVPLKNKIQALSENVENFSRNFSVTQNYQGNANTILCKCKITFDNNEKQVLISTVLTNWNND